LKTLKQQGALRGKGPVVDVENPLLKKMPRQQQSINNRSIVGLSTTGQEGRERQ
jgi:hypothetical protein